MNKIKLTKEERVGGANKIHGFLLGDPPRVKYDNEI